ncbi:MAG: hypothetical protein H0U76_06115 [Ktedonobacteraceae bacterium]|nr:hypothetical protein [Ktedonobacteraceae bacterium]
MPLLRGSIIPQGGHAWNMFSRLNDVIQSYPTDLGHIQCPQCQLNGSHFALKFFVINVALAMLFEHTRLLELQALFLFLSVFRDHPSFLGLSTHGSAHAFPPVRREGQAFEQFPKLMGSPSFWGKEEKKRKTKS